MKKYLLPEGGQFYKANLHCHSTFSDGRLSPEQIKEAYMEKGYSIVAYTDHDLFIPHPELNEEKFLALHGYEMEINEPKEEPFEFIKTCHMCFIALDPDTVNQACYHRTKGLFGNARNFGHLIKFDESLPDFERAYTPERISEMMKTGRDSGFFVTYNHPGWSMEEKEQYCNYHGMHAMEICNYGCFVNGHTDYNEKEYDQMLRGGERIFCIAADDNHNFNPLTSSYSDSFGGFTMIKADKLEYKCITDALLAGNFYASQGPEINELWIEDGKIHITCSDAVKIILNTATRRTGIVYAGDKPLNSASFPISKECGYVRLTVVDKTGKKAATNAYFVDEILEG